MLSMFTLLIAALGLVPPIDPLTLGVKEIAGPGSPGVVLALNEHAACVVAGTGDDHQPLPVVVAAEWGLGRVVAFGHSGYIDDGAQKDRDTGVLMANALRWAGRKEKPRVGVLDGDLSPLKESFTLTPMGMDYREHLGEVDVLVIGGRDLGRDEREAIAAFITKGGGLIVAQTGWGWQQIKGGPSMRINTLNLLLHDAGIAWTDEIINETSKDGFAVGSGFMPPSATEAVALLAGPEAGKGDAASLARASAVLTRAVRVLPRDDKSILPRLTDLVRSHEQELVPTAKKPITTKQPLLRTLLALQTEMMLGADAEDVVAHASSADFPGGVADDAPRVTRDVVIDRRVPGWHGTGLYAPPGKMICVTLKGDARLDSMKGMRVRIGCHKDELWHLPQWKRVPEITKSWALERSDHIVASPFGGLVYIDVDKTMDRRVTLQIDNCVESPRFVMGQTSVAEWKRTIRNAPGPWGEIETPSVIVSLPSSALRTLDNPDELCTLWQSVLDHAADLGSIPRARKSPERYVPDVQISAGYMHSGYPIMTHMDAVDEMSQAAKLKAGSWGLFHELGHNHQKKEWTFDGTGEVTNNLWSLYLMEMIAGKKPGQGHEATDQWAKRRERAQKHIETGADFKKWKSDPFLALEMYLQLREAFGWEPFKKVFAEYQTLKADEKPKNDQEERDQWLTRMSRSVGKNLGPFFEKWGVPVSATARDAIKDLPAWLPAEMEK